MEQDAVKKPSQVADKRDVHFEASDATLPRIIPSQAPPTLKSTHLISFNDKINKETIEDLTVQVDSMEMEAMKYYLIGLLNKYQDVVSLAETADTERDEMMSLVADWFKITQMELGFVDMTNEDAKQKLLDSKMTFDKLKHINETIAEQKRMGIDIQALKNEKREIQLEAIEYMKYYKKVAATNKARRESNKEIVQQSKFVASEISDILSKVRHENIDQIAALEKKITRLVKNLDLQTSLIQRLKEEIELKTYLEEKWQDNFMGVTKEKARLKQTVISLKQELESAGEFNYDGHLKNLQAKIEKLQVELRTAYEKIDMQQSPGPIDEQGADDRSISRITRRPSSEDISQFTDPSAHRSHDRKRRHSNKRTEFMNSARHDISIPSNLEEFDPTTPRLPGSPIVPVCNMMLTGTTPDIVFKSNGNFTELMESQLCRMKKGIQGYVEFLALIVDREVSNIVHANRQLRMTLSASDLDKLDADMQQYAGVSDNYLDRKESWKDDLLGSVSNLLAPNNLRPSENQMKYQVTKIGHEANYNLKRANDTVLAIIQSQLRQYEHIYKIIKSKQFLENPESMNQRTIMSGGSPQGYKVHRQKGDSKYHAAREDMVVQQRPGKACDFLIPLCSSEALNSSVLSTSHTKDTRDLNGAGEVDSDFTLKEMRLCRAIPSNKGLITLTTAKPGDSFPGMHDIKNNCRKYRPTPMNHKKLVQKHKKLTIQQDHLESAAKAITKRTVHHKLALHSDLCKDYTLRDLERTVIANIPYMQVRDKQRTITAMIQTISKRPEQDNRVQQHRVREDSRMTTDSILPQLTKTKQLV